LREALATLDPSYRFLALTTVTDELAEVYAMTYQAQREFEAEGIRDFSSLITITPEVGRPKFPFLGF
jgi:hypothetical protein